MANARILYNNLWTASTSTVTASSETSALPAKATQNIQRTSLWRSAAEATVWVKADLGSAQAVTGAALANFRVVSGTLSTLKLQSSPDDAVWTDYATFPAADTESGVTFVFSSSLSRRYWRVLATPTAGTISIEIGIVNIGAYLEPADNAAFPALPVNAPDVVVSAVDGQPSVAARTPYVTSELRWPVTTLAVAALLRAAYRAVYLRQPVFLVLETSLSWTALCVFFRRPFGQEFLTPTKVSVSIPYEEAR